MQNRAWSECVMLNLELNIRNSLLVCAQWLRAYLKVTASCDGCGMDMDGVPNLENFNPLYNLSWQSYGENQLITS